MMKLRLEAMTTVCVGTLSQFKEKKKTEFVAISRSSRGKKWELHHKVLLFWSMRQNDAVVMKT